MVLPRKIALLLMLAIIQSVSQATEISAVVQANMIQTDDLIGWQEKGTGVLRDDQSGLNLQQALIVVSQDIGSDFNFNVVGNYYQDGEQHLGLSQAQLIYKPLSQSTIKWRARAGFFYPKMSLENVDTGWLSPYTYTQSAINSWIGEELRTAGLEASLYSPGRARRSPWSWEIHAATFKGNDPLGTLISWRGFAMHDRQSLNNDRVKFAPYPTVTTRDGLWHPSWVEPFHEIDGRLGYYLGLHLDYYKKTSMRYYFYDNKANPLAVNDQRLYGWRTKFHSLALQHKLSRSTRLLGQLLTGSSLMGSRFVYIDYDAWYLMLSHKIGSHRLSARYDQFKVREDDVFPWDYNDSDGYGLTFAWRYQWTPNWQLGAEIHLNENSATNRMELNQPIKANQQQSMLVTQFSW